MKTFTYYFPNNNINEICEELNYKRNKYSGPIVMSVIQKKKYLNKSNFDFQPKRIKLAFIFSRVINRIINSMKNLKSFLRIKKFRSMQTTVNQTLKSYRTFKAKSIY